MKASLHYLFAILLLYANQAIAEPASIASIKQLFEVTQIKRVSSAYQQQVDVMLNAMISQSMQDKQPTPEQKEAIDHFIKKITAIFQQDLSWDKLEPEYIKLYQASLTEEEIEGMIAFYKTPAGQALIIKMPKLMEQTTSSTQQRLQSLLPKLQQAEQELISELKTSNSKAKQK